MHCAAQETTKKSAVLSKVVYHCSSGPEDFRDVEAVATEPDPEKRVKKIALGLSCRVGCRAHFAVRIQPDASDVAEILYYTAEHSAACKVMNRPD